GVDHRRAVLVPDVLERVPHAADLSAERRAVSALARGGELHRPAEPGLRAGDDRGGDRDRAVPDPVLHRPALVHPRGSDHRSERIVMYELDLTGEAFRDKVLGCWMGKNCGGTLGTPVEEAWGRPEPFDIWWYPELQSGGLPNDDLEMQLVWLTALEQVGPELTAADLARYWLDHIGYNFDEYGLSKANLRLGLEPPVSGAFNNWFVDCMGCPIRSEVWACIAPGMPRIAARYAYHDAVCDHAGGESVFG